MNFRTYISLWAVFVLGIIGFAAAIGMLTIMKNPAIIAKEQKIARDLTGHLGHLREIEFLSEKNDQVIVAVITRDGFLKVLEINYHYCLTHCHEKIESVEERYVKKID